MSNMSINDVVSTILADAANKVGEALIERAAVINSCFDDAYGSCLGGHYASGMECTAEGLRQLDDLLAYADSAMSTADGPAWEYVRDALGSVRMEKAPLQDTIIEEYNRRIKRYVSPSFGNSNKLVVCRYDGYDKERRTSDETLFNFNKLLHEGRLLKATMATIGGFYDYNLEKGRWVLDSLINRVVRPDLAKYMK